MARHTLKDWSFYNNNLSFESHFNNQLINVIMLKYKPIKFEYVTILHLLRLRHVGGAIMNQIESTVGHWNHINTKVKVLTLLYTSIHIKDLPTPFWKQNLDVCFQDFSTGKWLKFLKTQQWTMEIAFQTMTTR